MAHRTIIDRKSHSPAVTKILEEQSVGLISGVHYEDVEEFLAGKEIPGGHANNYRKCKPFDSEHRDWAVRTFQEAGIKNDFGNSEESFRKASLGFYMGGFPKGLSFSGKIEGAPLQSGIVDIRPKALFTEDAGLPWTDVDPTLLRQGEPAFTAFGRRSKARGRVLSIVCVMGGHCGLSGDQLFWSPLLGCRILELARASGIPTAFEFINICQHQPHEGFPSYGYYAVPICRSDETVVYESALALGQGGIFRTFGFMGIMATTAKVESGLGYPGAGVDLMKKLARHQDKEAIAAMYPGGCIFVDQVIDEAGATKELNRVVGLISDGLFRSGGGIFA